MYPTMYLSKKSYIMLCIDLGRTTKRPLITNSPVRKASKDRYYNIFFHHQARHWKHDHDEHRSLHKNIQFFSFQMNSQFLLQIHQVVPL